MANFTEAEAKACTIVRMEKKINGSTFVEWVFGVTDADGNYYDWVDSNVKNGAAKATIKTAIETHLKNNVEKMSAPIVLTITEITNKGKGETVG